MVLTHIVDLKSCPRCGGFFNASHDAYGDFMECLQCGYVVDVIRSRDRTRPGPPQVVYSVPDPRASRSRPS